MTGRKNNFDLLRLAAATQVLIIHATDHLHGQVPTALLRLPGVPIFFVISGYLVAASLRRNDLATYARARALRIYPALWVCLLLSMATCDVSFWRIEAIPWFLAQISFLQFYNPDFLRGYGVGVLNGSLWTIPVELQFYVLLPFLIRLRTPALIVIAGLSALLSAIEPLGKLGIYIGVTVAPHLYLFLLGVLLQRHPVKLNPYLWVGIYAASSLLLGALGFEVAGNRINPASAVLLGTMVIALAHSRPIPLKYDISYGLYIYHMPVINRLLAWGATDAIVIAIATSFALATASWLLVERVALSFKVPKYHLQGYHSD